MEPIGWVTRLCDPEPHPPMTQPVTACPRPRATACRSRAALSFWAWWAMLGYLGASSPPALSASSTCSGPISPAAASAPPARHLRPSPGQPRRPARGSRRAHALERKPPQRSPQRPPRPGRTASMHQPPTNLLAAAFFARLFVTTAIWRFPQGTHQRQPALLIQLAPRRWAPSNLAVALGRRLVSTASRPTCFSLYAWLVWCRRCVNVRTYKRQRPLSGSHAPSGSCSPGSACHLRSAAAVPALCALRSACSTPGHADRNSPLSS